MRTGGGKAQIPGSEIPDHRSDQQRKHHREPARAAYLQDQFDRQQRQNAKCHGACGKQHSREVEESRPCDRDVRLQRVRIDDGRNRIGGVVESIDELKAERYQQCAAKHNERADRGSLLDGKVGNQMACRVEHACGEDQAKHNHPAHTWASGELCVNCTFRRSYTFDGRCHVRSSVSLSGLKERKCMRSSLRLHEGLCCRTVTAIAAVALQAVNGEVHAAKASGLGWQSICDRQKSPS